MRQQPEKCRMGVLQSGSNVVMCNNPDNTAFTCRWTFIDERYWVKQIAFHNEVRAIYTAFFKNI